MLDQDMVLCFKKLFRQRTESEKSNSPTSFVIMLVLVTRLSKRIRRIL